MTEAGRDLDNDIASEATAPVGAASTAARSALMERWQRVPVLALVGVILLLLAGVLTAAYGERLYAQQRLRDAEVQAKMLAASVAEALDFEDTAAARDNVSALRADPEVAAAGVYDSHGFLVASYLRDGVPPPASTSLGWGAAEDNRIALTAPVLQGDRRVGTIYLRTDLEPFARRLTRYGGIALLAIMGSLVVVVLGVAHAAMRRANAALAESNAQLRAEAIERANAEQALRQAQKMQAVGQLTGGIAHDFNNLLTPITGGLEFIATFVEDERMKRMANNALEAARRGAKLTGQLLAFSRIQRLSVSSVAVNDVITGMQELLRHSIGGTVAVQLDLDPDAGQALCDANQIENAILNLAINARDAMPDGGTLAISTARTAVSDDNELKAGDYVVLAVTDSGTGMPPDVLARAIEPFFTTKPVGKGTGLGLAQVYGIVHQYGGTMHIDSREGQGTTVRILLPTAPPNNADEAIAGKDRAVSAVAVHQGGDILVIDDDEEVRVFVASALEALGYRVRTADGGEAGLQMLDAGLPDLLLVDFAMPRLNGAEIARDIRARHAALPIVFITGYADTAALEAALGPDAPVLRKPFGVDELADVVSNSLERAARRAAEDAKNAASA